MHVLLSGCATQAEIQAELISSNGNRAIDDFNACVLKVFQSSEFTPIRDKIPYNVAEASIKQLSDASRATPDQVEAIFVAHPQYSRCRTEFFNSISSTSPGIGTILAAAWMKNDADLVKVVQRKITWGEYVQLLQAVDSASQRDLSIEVQRIAEGLMQSHQAELQRRREALAAIAAYAQQQQAIEAMRRPVPAQPTTTNCRRYGNQVTCQTF